VAQEMGAVLGGVGVGDEEGEGSKAEESCSMSGRSPAIHQSLVDRSGVGRLIRGRSVDRGSVHGSGVV
jgi:hypothetical protein